MFSVNYLFWNLSNPVVPFKTGLQRFDHGVEIWFKEEWNGDAVASRLVYHSM